ncbi:MAG: hypothetical protein AUJ56_12635 [Zetaproteobacteria bacterium CG1_02_49_23]|nr:MAG: hypothetical protein AUJ56_12635 [Zetaproteobacteria bacterium CG1_02_49_23]
MRGKSVATLQAQLRHRGFVINDPASVFGPTTRDAVKALQKQLSLKATGTVDSALWKALAGNLTSSAEPDSPELTSTTSPDPSADKLEALIQLLISKGIIEPQELDALLHATETKMEKPLFL